MFVEGQKRVNQENDELKRELLSLRKDYDVEIKAMFLELNRVKEELSNLKQSSDLNDRNAKSPTQNYHENPLNSNRPNNGFEKKIPNSRYVESNNSSLGNCLFEYSSRSRIYGD